MEPGCVAEWMEQVAIAPVDVSYKADAEDPMDVVQNTALFHGGSQKRLLRSFMMFASVTTIATLIVEHLSRDVMVIGTERPSKNAGILMATVNVTGGHAH